jgi:aspartate/methionine/tyrosine aminotransferase
MPFQSEEGGFVPPVYPFDKLTDLAELAAGLPGGMVDLSIGTPCDPPPARVIEALATSDAERGYPTSVGSDEMREEAAAWIGRRFAVTVDAKKEVASCVGTKEFVAGLPQWLRLRSPGRDTVLYPALAYPTYEMGAVLARCRAVPVAARPDGTMDLSSVSREDAGRALCLWVNSPGNPAGQLEDLGAAAAWGREHGVPVFSDECYVEFTWAGDGRGHSILEHGTDGVVALHSLSKRSNLAGLRVGVYAGDRELVGYLAALRRHAGFMVPGPVQHAAAVAFADDEDVAVQRHRYEERLDYLATVLAKAGIPAEVPQGSFYLWVPVPESIADGDGPGSGSSPESPAFRLARHLAERAGVLVSPGDAYGPTGTGHVRLAAVQPMERLALVGRRLGAG